MSESLPHETIRQAAIDLLDQDAAFDDTIFTPPGAIGLGLDGPDGSSVPATSPDQPPHNTGAAALEIPTK